MTGYAVGSDVSPAGNGFVVKTTDGGVTWNLLPTGTTNALKSVWFTDVNHGVAVGASGIILKTADGGVTWDVVSIYQTVMLNSVYFTDDSTGYAVGSGMVVGLPLGMYINIGTLFKTIDGGATWISLPSGTANGLASVFFSGTNAGYAVGIGGTILSTIKGIVSISETSRPASSFTLFPNPTNGRITITNKKHLKEVAIITIFDSKGATVLQEEFLGQNPVDMDVSSLTKGIYFVKIQNEWEIETKKLVIQ